MTDKERIGFIGVGLMGHGMAANILAKGWPLTVMAHRNRAPVDDLVSRGAGEAATPREVALASDVVVLCVTGTPQVRARSSKDRRASPRPGGPSSWSIARPPIPPPPSRWQPASRPVASPSSTPPSDAPRRMLRKALST